MDAMAKRVLITGHEGYIGSVMTPLFIQAGYDVTGLDTGYFRDCTLVPCTDQVKMRRKDLRDLVPTDLKGFDAVVHLAALSNDPIGNLNRAWTEEINYQGSLRLAELAKAAGVQRFLFSSSCIMYGMTEAAVATEDSPLDPKTEYAASKVKAEHAIAQLASDRFSPTYLRNGTVYGVSPRMRFDTVLNNLMAAGVTTGEVKVFSDGKPWRPVIHVQDIARSFLAVLEAPLDAVHNQAFNNGANHLNHQIIELAQIVVDTVPDCKLVLSKSAGADQRTYKADFAKFARTFPKFQFQWTARTGAQELYDAFKRVRLTREQFGDRRFTRLAWLNHLLETQRLNSNLRWQEIAAAARKVA
jgi:nucleoside-diphosphate-sugar epimerase